MSPRRILVLVGRDLRLGPRVPAFRWMLLMPLLMTFLAQVVFVALLDSSPRLGIADLGSSDLAAAAGELEGIELTRADSSEELKRLVREHRVDVGLLLPAGFDSDLRAGRRPGLDISISGESLASHRIILAVTALDLVRRIEGLPDPVRVEVRDLGDGEALPIQPFIVVSMVLFALVVASVFLPAFMLVEDREQRTLEAVLVTPVRLSEVLWSKVLLGLILAVPMAAITLLLNGAVPANFVSLLVTLTLASLFCTEIGLVYGTLARDARTLYSLVKSLNILVLGPVIFLLFPAWPRWIARLFPSWYFMEPLYRVGLEGATLRDVWPALLVLIVLGALGSVPVALLGRRLQRKLAGG